jgi:hypothetical protein
MPDASRARSTVVAAVLILAGLLLLGLYRLIGGTEPHAYAPGATPPNSVQVTAGHTYRLSVPGGVKALHAQGLQQGTLRCSLTGTDGIPQPLTLTRESDGTRATNVVASFTAPAGGPVHADCTGWGAMFVDDADDAPADTAGWCLLGSIVALTVGVGLALSAARSRLDAPRAEESADA